MKKKFIPILLGILCLLITVLIYALVFDSIFAVTVRWVSLGFLMLAEILLILKYVLGNRSIIMGAQNIISAFHILAVIVVSVLYFIINDTALRSFVLINVVLLLLVAIGDLLILYADKRVNASNRTLAKNQGVIADCAAAMERIIAENPSSGLAKELNALIEAIKYSDNTVLSGDEGAIMDKLAVLANEMKSADDEAQTRARETLDEIKTLIANRNIYVKQNKRGAF